jgi:hypothetical protein
MENSSLRNIHRLIDAATSALPVEQAFVADLNATVERVDAEKKRKPSKTYKPSSMKCLRNMYFQRTGAELDTSRTSSTLIGICHSGSDRHERIQEAVSSMRKMGIDCDYIDVGTYVTEHNLDYIQVVKKSGYETKLFHTKLGMSFLCDGIILYKGEYYILEIKTESVYKFQVRQGVAEEHIPQGTAYSVAFGIDKVLFLYECRDTCDKKAFLLEVDEDMKYKYVIGPIEECETYVSEMLPPPVSKSLPKIVCDYCNYRTICKKVGK